MPVTISMSELFLVPIMEYTWAPMDTWSCEQDSYIPGTLISGGKPGYIKALADPWNKAWNNHENADEILARNDKARPE